MPVTFLDGLFRKFCVNIFYNIDVSYLLLVFVGSFFNHPVWREGEEYMEEGGGWAGVLGERGGTIGE